jgi:hypothetical protein
MNDATTGALAESIQPALFRERVDLIIICLGERDLECERTLALLRADFTRGHRSTSFCWMRRLSPKTKKARGASLRWDLFISANRVVTGVDFSFPPVTGAATFEADRAEVSCH